MKLTLDAPGVSIYPAVAPQNSGGPFVRKLVALGILILVFSSVTVWAEEAPAPMGFYIEPAFALSTFTTVKGAVERDLAGEGTDELNIHTGDMNWIFMPNLALGWGFGDWRLAVRGSYLPHLIKLNLPYGDIAEGVMHSIEVGPEVSYRVMSLKWTTVEAEAGLAARVMAAAEFDYDYADQPGPTQTNDFTGATVPGFSVHVGAGGDLMRGEHVLLGWLARFYWGRYDLESDDRIVFGHTPIAFDRDERMQLNVYSMFIGMRLRIHPFVSARSGK